MAAYNRAWPTCSATALGGAVERSGLRYQRVEKLH